MGRSLQIFIILLFSKAVFLSQSLVCPSPYVYMDGGSFISFYDPNAPLSLTNPSLTNIPTFGSGLTLMPNINGGTLTPTFYTVSGGNYYYWNGVAWTNTGHSVGNAAAVNIAGCAGQIYNIVGGTGQIYSYNGTSNGSLLTTLTGFNGGGPYDLVTDCNCNFYALNTTTPNQGLSMYSPSGALQCTYTLSGMPNTTAGGGFAIIGNIIYVKNNISSPGGFYVGTISGSGVTFTTVSGFNNSPGDFASCPVCNPSTNLGGTSISGGLLGCTIPTTNLIVTTTASPVTYSWTGPGILGAANGSFVVVNAPGTYSCFVSTSGCPPAQVTLTTSVVSNSTTVLASITPSGNICVSSNVTTQLVVTHSSASDIIAWFGPNVPASQSGDTLLVSSPGSYTVMVTDIFNGCVGKDVVTISQTPTISLALSDNTLCLQNFNGSPASITLTPSGASNYTLLTTSNYSTSSPNGPTMPCVPVLFSGNLSPLATATLIGKNSFCSDTTTVTFVIVPNPTVVPSQLSASICPGGSQAFSVSGASQYLWGGSAGLNTYSGNNVIANPSASSIYSVMGGGNGCMSQTKIVSLTVLPIPSVFVSPLNSTVCLGTAVTLSASGSATSFTWYPAGLTGSTGINCSVSPANTQVYNVVGSLNTCTNNASAQVTIIQPPVLSLSLSSPTLCAQSTNNSPSSINLSPSGATNYTLVGDNSVSVISPNGPVMLVQAQTPAPLLPTVSTATLIGESGVCKVSITHTFTIIPNPDIMLSPTSASVCPGQSQTFSVSGAATYTWLPMPNYTLSSANSIIAKPAITSFYSVMGSLAGCNSAIKNVVLLVLPIPNVSITPNTTTVCAGNTVTLSTLGNGTSFNWSPSQYLSSTYGANVTTNPFTTQIYTVVATLNTCTNSAVATVSAIVIPVISASAVQPTICSGSPTNLTVVGANSFVWLPSQSLNFASGNAVIASPNTSTTYTIHGYNGVCTGSTSLFVQTVKRPDISLEAPYNQICIGGSVPITVSGAQNYTWVPTSGLIPSNSNTLVIAAPLVSTNYTVYGANSLGTVSCYQQLSYSVIVIPVIEPVASENISLCEGEKTTLFALGGNTFSWTPPYGLNVYNASRVVANPSISTIYTVDVSHNSFCGKTTTIMVTVSPRPKVFAGRDTSYNSNDAIFVNASGTGTLTWISGEDVLCKVCPKTQVFPTRNGCYVAETVNEYGCKATDDVCFVLTDEFTVYIPNTFTPNNDGKNDVFLIFGENISDISMEIYDRWGVRVFSSNDYRIGWDGTYKDAACPSGVYTTIIKYTGLDRKKYTQSGHIMLLR